MMGSGVRVPASALPRAPAHSGRTVTGIASRCPHRIDHGLPDLCRHGRYVHRCRRRGRAGPAPRRQGADHVRARLLGDRGGLVPARARARRVGRGDPAALVPVHLRDDARDQRDRRADRPLAPRSSSRRASRTSCSSARAASSGPSPSRSTQPAYIPRYLTFEITERIDAEGGVLVPLDEQNVLATVRAWRRARGRGDRRLSAGRP